MLGTSLPEGFKLAEKAVNVYALRMQIEEAFRDLKSTRFGLSLELHRTYQLERLQVLLLIATLALMVAWLLASVACALRTIKVHGLVSCAWRTLHWLPDMIGAAAVSS